MIWLESYFCGTTDGAPCSSGQSVSVTESTKPTRVCRHPRVRSNASPASSSSDSSPSSLSGGEGFILIGPSAAHRARDNSPVCVPTTPFGSPVEPDVYTTYSASSAHGGGSGSAGVEVAAAPVTLGTCSGASINRPFQRAVPINGGLGPTNTIAAGLACSRTLRCLTSDHCLSTGINAHPHKSTAHRAAAYPSPGLATIATNRFSAFTMGLRLSASFDT